jgi:hypothetical protein
MKKIRHSEQSDMNSQGATGAKMAREQAKPGFAPSLLCALGVFVV